MRRFLLLTLTAFLAFAAPARADDISAAGRSVVRVVVIAFEDGEVVDFSHGSGFAVAPNRVVTNAHVVAAAAQEGLEVVVGVVPSEGSQAYRARLVTSDPARDLALVELVEGNLPPIPLYVGPLDDGSPVAALGYPGNVDLATAQSAEDYITPVPPTRSTGIFSNERPIAGITTLLHTASIARGHSGGPLLDPCGRVLGVNTLITRNQNGDSAFFFAVANEELTAFLRQAQQPFASVSGECVSMADRLAQDRERAEDQARIRRAESTARQEQARERALARIQDQRESRLALAILLLVLSLIAFGGAGILLLRNRMRPAAVVGGAGTLLLIAAVVAFVSRPSREDIDLARIEAEAAARGTAAPLAGPIQCLIEPERSRITVSSPEPVTLDWGANGCADGRVQYARGGDVWTRILVPENEQSVSVREVRPADGELVVTRFFLAAETMEEVRALAKELPRDACAADPEARTILADRQRDILQSLPRLPNERLVYRCRSRAARAG